MAHHNDQLCPCGSQNFLRDCCARYWQGALAPSPEHLMRARYSAFACKKADFLLATVHPAHHQADEKIQLQANLVNTQWLALHILACAGDDVEFVAFYQTHQTIGQLHERSRFVYEQERWWYLEGIFLAPVKWERNTNCWCGRGIKYKKCHG